MCAAGLRGLRAFVRVCVQIGAHCISMAVTRSFRAAAMVGRTGDVKGFGAASRVWRPEFLEAAATQHFAKPSFGQFFRF
eukprot:COSAG06_NODE_6682_length_2828_cov_3.340418_5_plen_79_part_00